jgi:apolipoprotein N-acyltransferase
MSQPEYIAALLSIIVGLALTDLAQSFRELVRPRRKVNWHWLPLLWAANMFFLAIQLWWNSFALLTEATSTFFFPFLLTFLLLYLACAFALPDPGWRKSQPRGGAPRSGVSTETLGTEPSLDLKAFHFSVAAQQVVKSSV